jgi:hypothetical protein
MLIIDLKNDGTDSMSFKQMNNVKCSQFTVKTTVEFILCSVLQKTFYLVVTVSSYSLQ